MFIYSLLSEARVFLYALSAFVLLLFFGTCLTDFGNEPVTPDIPNTIYMWHRNKDNGLLKIADICGTGHENDNAFIHVRQEKNKALEAIFWFRDKELKYNAHYNISIRFDSVVFDRKCRYVINNDSIGVLYIDKPKMIVQKMTENETFDVIFKQRHKIIDIFHFNSPRLKW